MTASVTQPAESDEAAHTVALMRSHREQLTHLLRGLAARLDELERRLAYLTWPRHGSRGTHAIGELHCEQTALENEQRRLTERLGLLAQQLQTFDNRLAHADSHENLLATKVGTCPYCGYPSLGSGLCAFCRPQLAR